jgi:Troponin
VQKTLITLLTSNVFFLLPQLLLRKKAAEELKKEQERKAAERRRIIEQRCGKPKNVDDANEGIYFWSFCLHETLFTSPIFHFKEGEWR